MDYKVQKKDNLFIFDFDTKFEGYEQHIEFIMNEIWKTIIKDYGQSIQYETMFYSDMGTGKLFVEVIIK